MTDAIEALYDTLGDLTKTLFVFKDSTIRFNEELAHLAPHSPEYRAKELERDVAQHSWENAEQACQVQKRLIERLERDRPEPTPMQEPILTEQERDFLLGIREDDTRSLETPVERDDFDRDR